MQSHLLAASSTQPSPGRWGDNFGWSAPFFAPQPVLDSSPVPAHRTTTVDGPQNTEPPIPPPNPSTNAGVYQG